MNWSDTVWDRIAPFYQNIIEMPFNRELQEGSLPLEKFKFYMAQDAYYLGEFGKCLSAISGRLSNLDQVLAFSQFASGAIVVERALHESYFKDFGLDEDIKPSFSCLAYTNYILNKAAYANVEVAVAAVLPCFWIYKKVGDHIYTHQKKGNHPYQKWIDTYAGEEFAHSVQQAIAIADDLATRASPSLQKEMFQAFEMATWMEWKFWDSAYEMEKWEGLN